MGRYGAVADPGATALGRQAIFSKVDTTGSDLSEIDIINPSPAATGSATVSIAAFDKNGLPLNSQQVQVDGQTRVTVNVNDVVGRLQDVFSTTVTSDRPVWSELLAFYGGDRRIAGGGVSRQQLCQVCRRA